MTLASLLALSVGLAMDATAVAMARGLAAPKLRARDVLRVALLFGGFQAIMPVVGWSVGHAVGPKFAAWNHWVAIAVLVAVGGKMIADARSNNDANVEPDADHFGMRVLLLLAVATSLDALAAGFTLPLLGAPLWSSVACIGVVTAALSALGVVAGRRFGKHLGGRLDVLGGVVLLILALKILLGQVAR